MTWAALLPLRPADRRRGQPVAGAPIRLTGTETIPTEVGDPHVILTAVDQLTDNSTPT